MTAKLPELRGRERGRMRLLQLYFEIIREGRGGNWLPCESEAEAVRFQGILEGLLGPAIRIARAGILLYPETPIQHREFSND